MGQRFTFLAQPHEALHCHQQALALFEQAHDPGGLAETLDCLGLFHYGGGDLIAGARYYEQAVSVLRTQSDHQRLVQSLSLLMLCKGPNYHNDVLPSDPASLAESL
jgi:hypothetical protein